MRPPTVQEWAREAIALARSREPSLTRDGFQPGRPLWGAEAEIEVAAALLYLAGARRAPLRSRRAADAHWLKHVIQRDLGVYISTGAAVVAAIATGIPYRRLPGGRAWNARVGVRVRGVL